MLLKDKIIVVTGASRGIGRAIAEVCVREGARVGINFLKSHAHAVSLRDQLCRMAPDCAFLLPFDVRQAHAIRDACQPVLDTYGRIDGWVNNAGIHLPGLLLGQSEAMIEQQVATNLMGTLLCCQVALEHMLTARAGAIVNLGSITSQRFAPGQSVYAATKAAVASLTQALAVEYGRKNIRINCVQPGPVATDMLKGAQQLMGDALAKRLPLQRLGTPHEVAELVVFLLSERASFITGAIMTADGGYGVEKA